MEPEVSPIKLERVKPLAQGANAFGLNLLQSLEPGDDNHTISPFSITCALAMLYLGAAGRTAQQMVEVFGFSKDPAEVQAGVRQFLDYVKTICREEPPAAEAGELEPLLESYGDLVFTVANAVWGQKEYPFRPEYLDRVRKNFDAHVENLQFLPTPEIPIEIINQWVSKHTRGRINSILDENLPWGYVRLILTNAVYFKASWEHPFYENATEPGPFYLADGNTAEAEFMHQQESFGYYHSEAQDFRALEMKYGAGHLGMVVLVPGKVDGLPALERWLTADKLEKLSGKLVWRSVNVTFPKFLMECQFGLAETLQAMGAGDVFDQGKADLPGIAEIEPVWVTEVLHKVWIDVNEKGTEAAAVTAVLVALGIEDYEPPPPVEFRADRPFLFYIRDRASGLILFLGRVTNPESPPDGKGPVD